MNSVQQGLSRLTARRAVSSFACGIAAFCGAGAARAQDDVQPREDAAAEELAVAEQIIVYGRRIGDSPGQTATRTGTPLLDVPFAVSTVTAELLELRGVQNIGQALETVSGVSRNFNFSGTRASACAALPTSATCVMGSARTSPSRSSTSRASIPSRC